MTAVTVVINQKHRDIIPTLSDKCQWWSFTCNTKCSTRDHRLKVPFSASSFNEARHFNGCFLCYGVSWPSGLVRRICVLMAESSECEFESWLQPWYLCPWARHFTIIASLHPEENGYLWGQSWLLCLISPMRRNGSNWAVYSPGSWDGFRNDLWAWWAGVIIHC